jgi:hypothetical protein
MKTIQATPVNPSNLDGHFNMFTPDQKSYVTGHGKHCRVMATIPASGELYCRIDIKWGLPVPTVKQVLKVANHRGDAKGKWKLKSWEEYNSNGLGRVDVIFTR